MAAKPRFPVSTQPPPKRKRPPSPPKGKVKRKRRRSPSISPLQRLLWGLIGLGLMVGGTLIKAHTLWPQGWQDWTVRSLQVNWQVGAVLLIGCLGGAQASLLSQISYVLLGLSGLAIFTDGGGLYYLQEPAFGYILGFIPGGWLCGRLAFRWRPVQLESLALSALAGLGVIHLCGIVYQIGLQMMQLFSQQVQLLEMGATLLQGIFRYSVILLPPQGALICAVSVLAFLLRRIMFY